MKNLMNLFLLYFASFLFLGCAPSGTVNVGSDQRTDSDFSDFQTYNWVTPNVEEGTNRQFSTGSEGGLIYNNKSTKRGIREAIETQLEAKGFTQDTVNPDMLVNFTVLEKDDQLRTYTREGYSYLGEGPVGQDVEMVDVEAGTILVNFVDAQTGLQVWQGFASGAFEESDLADEETLKAKVGAIFEEFDFSTFSINANQVPG